MIAKIAELVKTGTLTEIPDVRDLSDRSRACGIVIELKRDAIPQVVLNKLYKHTPLQSTFGYNAVALVDGVPRTLALRDLLQHYLDFQREVVTRRSKYELRKAEAPRARPPGLPDRARQPRRAHRADPRGGRHRRRPRGPHDASSSSARSRRRRSSTSASAR